MQIVARHKDNVHSQIVLIPFVSVNDSLTVPIYAKHTTILIFFYLLPSIERVLRRRREQIPIFVGALMKWQLLLEILSIFATIESN